MPRPRRVFDAWFMREQWQAWIGPEGCRCEVPVLEPKVGGRYRIQMHLSDGREIPVEGVFKVIDRPNALVFTWGWALSGKADTLVQPCVPRQRQPAPKSPSPMKACPPRTIAWVTAKGWNSTLNKLARYVKGEPV